MAYSAHRCCGVLGPLGVSEPGETLPAAAVDDEGGVPCESASVVVPADPGDVLRASLDSGGPFRGGDRREVTRMESLPLTPSSVRISGSSLR